MIISAFPTAGDGGTSGSGGGGYEPIGSIKYSASQNVGPEWLRCDGSFINERDYPELVAALGKLTPGVDSFDEVLKGSLTGSMSNIFMLDGVPWFFLIKSMELCKLDNGKIVKIPVSGADSLSKTADVVLSICGGYFYLAQSFSTTTQAILFEGVFNSTATSLSVTSLPVAGQGSSSLQGSYCYPYVMYFNNLCWLAFGTVPIPAYNANPPFTLNITFLTWTPGNFAGTVKKPTTIWLNGVNKQEAFPQGKESGFICLVSCNPKNKTDALIGAGGVSWCEWNSTWFYQAQFAIYSYPQNIYGSAPSTSGAGGVQYFLETYVEPNIPDDLTPQKFKDMWTRYWIDDYIGSTNILPVAGNSECLYELRTDQTPGTLSMAYTTYSPRDVIYYRDITELHLPSRARLFKESVCYAEGQSMWFIFLGTGLAFTTSLSTGKWGYLDTTTTLGTVTENGGVYYSRENASLILSGLNQTGKPVLGVMKLSDLFNYANDGAFLPNISSDGVPAYIKAKEPVVVP